MGAILTNKPRLCYRQCHGRTAKEINSNTTYSTVTTGAGDYSFPQVEVGTYNVTTTSPNFKTDQRTGIIVQINTPTVLNIQLTIGQQAETVTVTADAPTVESTSSDIGAVVTPQQVEELPLSLGGVGAFRSPEAFEFLLPGTVGPGTGNNANGIYIQKTSGGQNFGDDIVLDGSTAARPDNNSTFDETAPSVEALREFRIETATPPAQFDRTTGGVRSFTTRSGTNSFHGAAFDILRNTDLDANLYFNNLGLNTCAPGDAACRSTYAVPKDIKNDYGVTLGGPIFKNKTFFFFCLGAVAMATQRHHHQHSSHSRRARRRFFSPSHFEHHRNESLHRRAGLCRPDLRSALYNHRGHGHTVPRHAVSR